MRRAFTLMFVCLVLNAGSASGQGRGLSAIAGVVRDSTGAVVPGVTVEAASPALIEKVRTAVTDAQGRYEIIDPFPVSTQ